MAALIAVMTAFLTGCLHRTMRMVCKTGGSSTREAVRARELEEVRAELAKPLLS